MTMSKPGNLRAAALALAIACAFRLTTAHAAEPTSASNSNAQRLPEIVVQGGGKVQAVINEIDGLRRDGRAPAPVPALFGLNLQTINVAQSCRAT